MYVIAGLGNPTRKYEHTRHNMGFDVVDYIAGKYSIEINQKKHKGLCGTGYLEGGKVLLLKPQTFMNLSGASIREAVDFYKLDASRELIVIYDDIHLAAGNLRIRRKGSAGGHNGIKDIIASLGTEEFMRIRVGVGEQSSGRDLVSHVLGRFGKEERALVEEAIVRAAEAVLMMVAGDIDGAMNRYNKKVVET